MPRIEIDPTGIAQELATLGSRAARAGATLRAVAAARPGATPRQPVWQCDQVRLYRYGGEQAATRGPLLVVYALVNRPEMADLETGRSLVGGLLGHGFDVYLLDWGYPGSADRGLGLADYITRYLDGAVDHVRAASARAAIPLLGICQGGTFSACYAALEPDKVERLITTVTPIDFHTEDDALANLVRHVDIDALIAAGGNLGGDTLNALFLSLKPYQLLQQKYLRFLEQLDDAAASATFVRMEHWIFDSPALAARAAGEFARTLYQQNALVRGELTIGDRGVDLRRITMPVLNIFARNDHLVPPAASRALADRVGSADYHEHELPGGHIGVYVGSGARESVADVVSGWMRVRESGQEKAPDPAAAG